MKMSGTKMSLRFTDYLDQADNEDLRLKADLIRKFLDKVVPVLDKETNLDEAHNEFEEEEREGEIYDFCPKCGAGAYRGQWIFGWVRIQRQSEPNAFPIRSSGISSRNAGKSTDFEFVMENTRKFMSV